VSDEQTPGGNGSGEHPAGDLALAYDIDRWRDAGQRLIRLVVRLGGLVPPPGPGPAAELSQRIDAFDEEFRKFVEAWETVIRPALKKFEGAPVPPLTFL